DLSHSITLAVRSGGFLAFGLDRGQGRTRLNIASRADLGAAGDVQTAARLVTNRRGDCAVIDIPRGG
ncbi:MAG: hypothetical protein ACT4NU_08260, partial [Chromatiales bacterium]